MSNLRFSNRKAMEDQDKGKNEKTFSNFGHKVDEFVDELNEAARRLQKEFEQKYEELKISAERLKKEAGSNERWKEVETNLKKAGDELANAFKAAFRRK